MGWFRRKSNDAVYAERIYQALVEHELGDMTPEKLRLPNNMHQRYREKALLYREAWVLVSIATEANDPQLRRVMLEWSRLIQEKRTSRGGRDDSPDHVM